MDGMLRKNLWEMAMVRAKTGGNATRRGANDATVRQGASSKVAQTEIPTLFDDSLRRKAVKHLRSCDPRMAGVVEQVGKFTFQPLADGTHFHALIRAIVYQQLSGKAAATIHARFEGLYGGRAPRPGEVADTPDADLRSVGLSRQKLSYLKDLGERVDSGDVDLESLDHLPDDVVIETLTRIKGLGRWSAQMFLMFRLARVDVLPDLDLGIQKGVQALLELPELPKPKYVLEVGEPWRPYRTVASWYLWRSVSPG